MPVSDTTVTIRTGFGDRVELELCPNMMSSGEGYHSNARQLILVAREKRDDDNESMNTEIRIAVSMDEMRNAINLIEASHFNDEADEHRCEGCGRP